MDTVINSTNTFYREAPHISMALDVLLKALEDSKGLDARTKLLVSTAITKASGDTISLLSGGASNTARISSKLDTKTKQLVFIAMKAAAGRGTDMQYHVSMAKSLGATRDEIKDTVLLALTVSGIKDFLAALPNVLEAYDQDHNEPSKP